MSAGHAQLLVSCRPRPFCSLATRQQDVVGPGSWGEGGPRRAALTGMAPRSSGTFWGMVEGDGRCVPGAGWCSVCSLLIFLGGGGGGGGVVSRGHGLWRRLPTQSPGKQGRLKSLSFSKKPSVVWTPWPLCACISEDGALPGTIGAGDPPGISVRTQPSPAHAGRFPSVPCALPRSTPSPRGGPLWTALPSLS